MQLNANEIHVWATSLTITAAEEREKRAVLSPDECERADRFHFPIHRQRFIAARYALRQLLSFYLPTPPQDIIFAYHQHEKPYISSPNPNALQFNLAHSHDIAVYAFTLQHAVGIDIEKIQDSYDIDLAKRFFSPQENIALQQLTPEESIIAFYRLWARKEAIIKAIGKGLVLPLHSFTVSADDSIETIALEGDNWSLLPLSFESDYQAALASNQVIKKVSYWKIFDQKPQLVKTLSF